MSELEIIGGPASNFVWVCRIACAEKGVPYKLTSVMPHTPEVTAIHPLGKIPAMRHGNVTLVRISRDLQLYRLHVRRSAADHGKPAYGGPGRAMVVDRQHHHRSYLGAPVRGRLIFFQGRRTGPQTATAIDVALPKMEKQFPIMDVAVASGYLVGGHFHAGGCQLDPDPVLHVPVS